MPSSLPASALSMKVPDSWTRIVASMFRLAFSWAWMSVATMIGWGR